MSHVDIIESLPASDGYVNRTGHVLFIELDENYVLPARYIAAPGRAEFFEALAAVGPFASRKGLLPVVHIEAHGNGVEGLSLGSGETVSWRELKEYLVPINEVSRVNVLVFMAACNGQQMASILEPHDRAPFRLMIGPRREVSYQEVLDAARAFYTAVARRESGDHAFTSLNAAIAAQDEPFGVYIAEQAFRSVMKGYFVQHSSPGVIAEQRQRLMRAWIAQFPNASLAERAARRGQFDAQLHDHRLQHQIIRDKFFFLDRFPELAPELDGISFEECVAGQP